MTKTVSDAGVGGMIVASEEAFSSMSQEAVSLRAWVLHAGDHVLSLMPAASHGASKPASKEAATSLYQVLPHELTAR